MKSSMVIGMMLFLLFSSVGRADEFSPESSICFSTVSDWQKVRTQLPTTMQQVPIYAVHQSWDLTGAAEIITVGNTFQVNGKIHDIIVGDMSDSGTVTQACINGTQMTVNFAGGQSETIDLTANGISVDGYEFDTTNQKTYQSVMNSLN